MTVCVLWRPICAILNIIRAKHDVRTIIVWGFSPKTLIHRRVKNPLIFFPPKEKSPFFLAIIVKSRFFLNRICRQLEISVHPPDLRVNIELIINSNEVLNEVLLEKFLIFAEFFFFYNDFFEHLN